MQQGHGEPRWNGLPGYGVLFLIWLILGGMLSVPRAAFGAEPVAVDDKVTLSFTGFSLDRYTNTYLTKATVTNVSTLPIQTPILVFTSIGPSSVSLYNPSGTTTDGFPYISIPLADGVLDPGETVANLAVRFRNPNRVTPVVTRSVRGVLPAVNHPPSAEAGPDQSVYVGSRVTLDGSASTDLDGDPLTHHWQFAGKPADSLATLTGADGLHPGFSVDLPGTYFLTLVVNDGQADSTPDQVTISTQNSKPVAQAGPDQSAPVGSLVHLDGLASSDVDGDPLTHAWTLTGKPPGSAADLLAADTATPSLTLDRAGHYEASLVVHDGQAPSDPDLVAIDTQNSAPVARAGADQTGLVGVGLTLDGSASSDVDGDALSYAWSLLSQPAGSFAVLENPALAQCTLVPDLAGEYVAQLIVRDGHLDSPPDTALLTISVPPPPNQPPAFISSPPTTATVGQAYAYAATASDPDGDSLTYALTLAPAGMSLDAATGLLQWTPAQAGIFPLSLRVEDGRGGVASQAFDLVVDAPAPPPVAVPVLTGLARSAAEAALLSAGLAVGTVDFRHDAVVAAGLVLEQNPAAGVEVPAGTAVALTVSLGADIPLPPDPAGVAPPLDPTVATTLDAATEFLYTGANPIQTGVAPGAIEAKRAAVLRGRILDRAGQPLPGVTVTIKDHPEYGQTLSRADGYYDLAVNGGGVLTLNYEQAGRLPAQRQATPAWQDYAVVEDLVMIGLDAQVTAIDLGDAAQPFQVAQGSPVSDADGPRQATILFPGGTQATLTLADGTQQALSTLHVRATEYTVGENGPKTMPGPLPPTSGYTYAVELSVDEALAAGAKSVNFDRAVPVYVDNFLNFPVGETVPVGWYDRAKAAWIPSDNGRVIKILSIDGGMAALDVDGDSVADTGAELTALGITDAERAQLAQTYAAGKSLWRFALTHFSPWDCNWPYGPPMDAGYSPNPGPGPAPPSSCGAPGGGGGGSGPLGEIPGCSLNPQARTVGEEIPVTGTPYALHYRSRRADGYAPDRMIDIPLADANVPSSLARIEVSVYLAGRVYTSSFSPSPNQTHRFVWDGNDGYGRPVHGSAPATVAVRYWYPAVYYQARTDVARAFALASARGGDNTAIVAERTLPVIALTRTWHTQLLGKAPNPQALGDWNLDVQHLYDPAGRALWYGNGQRRNDMETGNIITSVAGTTISGYSGDGGQAIQAKLAAPLDVAFAPDGSYYIADISNYRVRKVGADGIITTVAGNGSGGLPVDGVPATQSTVMPSSLALGPDGSLYIADRNRYRIRRVAPDGIIRTIAGTGSVGFSGDGGSATVAKIGWIEGIAVGSDGSVYLADYSYGRIRRVGTDGIITTIAGNGLTGFRGDGGPATQAMIVQPKGVAIGPDGSLYISDYYNERIRKVTPDGIITTVAGNGSHGYGGDGGPATSASLYRPDGIAVAPDGSFYIGDVINRRIRRVGVDGIITTVAGTGDYGTSGNEGPATQATFRAPSGIALAPNGTLYIADSTASIIRRVGSSMPGMADTEMLIPSGDGQVAYRFDAAGRHLETLDALTRTAVQGFTYDSHGLLSRIQDAYGNLTQIERDATSQPIALIAPDGQRTELTPDANGRLATVRNPAGDTHAMTYTADDLLATFTNPRHQTNRFGYDAEGRLSVDLDAAGGGWTIAATEQENGYTNFFTSGEGRTSEYRVEYLSDGDRRHTRIAADGTSHSYRFGTNTATYTDSPADGTVTTHRQSPDPRFGMMAPLTESVTTTPGGLSAVRSESRSSTPSHPANPLSLTALTETRTLNGKPHTTQFSTASRTYTDTSPAGRVATTVVNAQHDPLSRQIAGLEPIHYAYDARGRLQEIRQGQGAEARITQYDYYADGTAKGYLHGITDPLARSQSYEYDAAGRIVRETLPDGRALHFEYDRNGNLTALIPPDRPAHVFDYTALDQTEIYTPPALVGEDPATRYVYNLDRQLDLITRPDGALLDFVYDAGGRLHTLHAPHGDTGYPNTTRRDGCRP